MRVRPKKMVWKFRWFIHNIFIHLGPFSSAMKNMAIICKSCFSSKSRVAQLSTNSCYKNAPYLERCSAFYKIGFAIKCEFHWRLRNIHFPPFYDSRNTLKEPWTWSKIDVWTTATYARQQFDNERSGHGYKQGYKQANSFLFHTSMPGTFWEIWVEVYAWLGVRRTTGCLRLQKAPMPLNWVLRIICIRKGKTQKVKYFLL